MHTTPRREAVDGLQQGYRERCPDTSHRANYLCSLPAAGVLGQTAAAVEHHTVITLLKFAPFQRALIAGDIRVLLDRRFSAH